MRAAPGGGRRRCSDVIEVDAEIDAEIDAGIDAEIAPRRARRGGFRDRRAVARACRCGEEVADGKSTKARQAGIAARRSSFLLRYRLRQARGLAAA